MQVILARLDGKILLERLRIVAVIAQLAGGLHEERGCGTVGNEVVGITDTEQMGKYLSSEAVVAGMLLTGVPHCQRAKEYSSTQ